MAASTTLDADQRRERASKAGAASWPNRRLDAAELAIRRLREDWERISDAQRAEFRRLIEPLMAEPR